MTKKISFFLSSLNYGGAEKVLVFYANYLIKQKYDVSVITLNSSGPLKKKINNNINIIDLKKNKLRNAIFAIIKVLKEKKIDIVVTSVNHCNILFCIIKYFFFKNFKLIIRQSNVFEKELSTKIIIKNFFYKFLIKFFYGRADKIITICKEVDHSIKKLIGNRKSIKLIYNPINTSKAKILSNKKVKNYWNKKSVKLLSVGSLTVQKNLKDLLFALSHIANSQKLKFYHLLIFGNGKLYKELKLLIKKLNIEKNVTIIKKTDNPFPYYNQTDLLIQTSLWEGLSNVLLEALSCNAKILAYKIPGGTSEALGFGKYGNIIKRKNYYDLANNIVKSANKKKTKIPRSHLKKFDSKEICLEFKKLILKL